MPAPLDHYAQLRPLEEQAVALWDQGMTVEDIADQLGKSREGIGSALSIATGGTDHIDFNRMVRDGTAQLGAAINAYFERAAA